MSAYRPPVTLNTACVWQVTSNCAPSMFAYPPPVTTETKDTGPKLPTAVLSTTAKAKDKAKKKEAEKAVKEGRPTGDQDKESKAEGDQHTHTDLLVMCHCCLIRYGQSVYGDA